MFDGNAVRERGAGYFDSLEEKGHRKGIVRGCSEVPNKENGSLD